MAENKKLAAELCLDSGRLLHGGDSGCRTPAAFAQAADDAGADCLFFIDCSADDAGHEQTIGAIREAVRVSGVRIFAGGRIRRLEDVKKYLYAGAEAVILDGESAAETALLKEAAGRFGPDKLWARLLRPDVQDRAQELKSQGASGFILALAGAEAALSSAAEFEMPCPYFLTAENPAAQETSAAFFSSLALPGCAGTVLSRTAQPAEIAGWKAQMKALSLASGKLTGALSWEDFRPGPSGLVPVIVQDYKTQEVLMLAYMNEQAWLDTLETGRMHYYSRSRRSQWMKGETSGHFQYVQKLKIDCDRDTILALVRQVGPACHTGARSCFFTQLAERDCRHQKDPFTVFEDVFAVIQDRKLHPKEGSYTNYLFDKGLDKILKKLGEEAAEIVIAAKNPDPEEVRYEACDFLYHLMVLMAEKGITWEEITDELANR